MRKKRGAVRPFKPSPIDRAIFGILAVLHMASGVYLSSPFYLDTWDEVGKAPLANLFNSDTAVVIYGVLLFLNGIALLYSASGKSATRFYTRITSAALLSGFLMRLYSFIGVAIALESWRPPSYLSHLATVFILGAYWVWIKVNGRTVQ